MEDRNKPESNRQKAEISRRQKQKQQNRRILILFLLIIGVLIVILVILLVKKKADTEKEAAAAALAEADMVQTIESLPDVTAEAAAEPVPAETSTPTPTLTPTPAPITPDDSSISSEFALLLRVRDGQVFFEKNADTNFYPASMTKVMTALVAIERLPDLNAPVTVTSADIDPSYEAGASLAGFVAGETVTVRDLLYGCLLPSGAEACVALANAAAGSETAFVDAMNQKAVSLGMNNTHFVTDSGLHDPNHYTNCRDMAILLQAALQNPEFQTLITSSYYQTTSTEQHPEGLWLESTLSQTMAAWSLSPALSNGGLLQGGKTGFTDEAGLCLASVATVNNEQYILITAHASGDHYTEPYHVLDALKLYGQLS